MQTAFDFGTSTEITWMRDRLDAAFGHILHMLPARDPIGQLVKSLISSRTLDEVSSNAFERLVQAYPTWADMAFAPAGEVRAVIADVTHADDKARYLGEALRKIGLYHPDFDLDFLGDWPIYRALSWLEDLRGVGPKVSASTLNFSTLDRPVFVVDTHVSRVLRRFGFIGRKAKTETACQTIMEAKEEWRAADFAELHVFLKFLGQTICRHGEGHCTKCPINERCKTAAARSVLFP